MTTSAEKSDLRIPWLVIAYVAALIALVAWLSGPTLAYLLRHRQYYPAAERVADELKALTQSIDPIDRSTVARALATDRFRHLEKLQVPHEPDAEELLWLKVNDMYSVGLGPDGAILWRVAEQQSNE